MDPIGFRYYIAAYMVWSLRNYEGCPDSLVVDHTLGSLIIPRNDSELLSWCRERYAIFTQDQATATSRFLQYMAEYEDEYADDAREALDGHWGKSFVGGG